jgi:hypothetical protein
MKIVELLNKKKVHLVFHDSEGRVDPNFPCVGHSFR